MKTEFHSFNYVVIARNGTTDSEFIHSFFNIEEAAIDTVRALNNSGGAYLYQMVRLAKITLTYAN